MGRKGRGRNGIEITITLSIQFFFFGSRMKKGKKEGGRGGP